MIQKKKNILLVGIIIPTISLIKFSNKFKFEYNFDSSFIEIQRTIFKKFRNITKKLNLVIYYNTSSFETYVGVSLKNKQIKDKSIAQLIDGVQKKINIFLFSTGLTEFVNSSVDTIGSDL